jgi:GWxTD domain-containing protein
LIKLKIIFSFFIALILLSANVKAQKEVKDNELGMYFDVLTFQSDSSGLSKADCFIVIPYQYLMFKANGSVFNSQFTATIRAYDSLSVKIFEKKIDRNIIEKDYLNVQGGFGNYDYINAEVLLKKGNYKLEADIEDHQNGNIFSRSRNVSVLNFNEYPFSLSGMLLLSSIEEVNGSMAVTPYLSDNVADLPEGFFVFFESYNNTNENKVDFVYKVFSADKLCIFTSDRISKSINQGKQQNYLNIQLGNNLKFGTYMLRVYALKPSDSSAFIESNIVAAAERSIKFIRSAGGMVLDDIDKAISQSFYAAENNEFEYMKDAKTDADKFSRFNEFWAKLDPSPGTDRNEAYDDYFNRIKYATEKFSHSGDGWKSDMGRVYIVFGPPYATERSASDFRGRIYEKWSYTGGRSFIFVDNNGFGEYKLYQPIGVSEKYKYGVNQ